MLVISVVFYEFVTSSASSVSNSNVVLFLRLWFPQYLPPTGRGKPRHYSTFHFSVALQFILISNNSLSINQLYILNTTVYIFTYLYVCVCVNLSI